MSIAAYLKPTNNISEEKKRNKDKMKSYNPD